MFKKIIALSLICLFQAPVLANVKTRYDLYVVPNTQKEIVESKSVNYIKNNYSITPMKHNSNDSNYYFKMVNGSDVDSYYVRFYQDFKNANIFVASSSRSASRNNPIVKYFESQDFDFKDNADKQIFQEYEFDFIKYSRENTLDDLRVFKKRTQWFENVVAKIDAKVVKDNKEFPRIAYSSEEKDLNLRKLSSDVYENSSFKIVKNKYKLKQKTFRIVHGYEYVITNKTNSDLTIKKVDSSEVVNIKDVTAKTYVDLDRIDVVAYTGTALAPFTLGLSMLACIPDWIRTVKIQTESVKFTKDFPVNYIIEAGENATILVLRDRINPAKLDFTINSSLGSSSFSF